MGTVTELTENYLRGHPSIKDCLKNNVVNYSKLARRIARHISPEKKSSVEAVLIACRRFAAKLKNEGVREEGIVRILRNGELEVKNKIVVAIIGKKTLRLESLIALEKKTRDEGGVFYAIEGPKVFTIIMSEKNFDDLNAFKKSTLRLSKNLAMVTIKNSEEVEKTPGFIAYLYSLLGENNINVVETMSCWTDTIIVISEEDLARTIKFLKF